MAGMLAGVECARRRKFHKNSGLLDSSSNTSSSTRRSFLCLYTSNHEHNFSSRFSKERTSTSQEYEDEKLGEVAREAKQRLDEKGHQGMEGVDLLTRSNWINEVAIKERCIKDFHEFLY